MNNLQNNCLLPETFKYCCSGKLYGFALYEEKVVPKNDLICGITQEEFEENEERIISGCCFSSYKRNSVVDWFNIKKKKVCPNCRNENGVWYFEKKSN
jgi:hypothetical protein